MATRTSVGSGLWSAAGTWDTGVPVNGDTAVIPVGFDVEFDVDISGFAAGVIVTLNGTLHASTTAGAYILKLAGNLTGSGTLRAGTEGTPYPLTCTFTIQRNGFAINSTTLTYDLNCTEPTIKWVKLTGVEAIGQTVWSVDTDVTADAQWASGAILRIIDVNTGNDSEERVFSSATANTITVTAGLTAQKETGAYVVLISRNVKITHTAQTGNSIQNARLGRIFAQIYMFSGGLTSPQNVTIGGTISNSGGTGIQDGASLTVSAVICGNASNGCLGALASTFQSNSLIGGCNQGFNASVGCTIFGIVAGCTSGFLTCTACLFYGTLTGCTRGIDSGGGHVFANATLANTNGGNDFWNTSFNKAFNTLFGGSTEFAGYNGVTSAINNFNESLDHDQTANQYRAWTRGGIVDSDTGTVYTGRTRSYKHGCASASFFVFQNRTFTVQPGGGLIVQCYVRKSVTMTYLPRVWILTPGLEPFISGSPTAEDIMTDSIDTWEELNLVYANGGTSPVDITVRTVAKNASGNVFFDPIITVLAPVTYDVYNTLLAYVDTLETNLATLTAYVDTEVAAIKAKTDNLPSDPADESNIQATLTTIAAYIDTEVSAIKAKTDNLPALPAATGDIPSASTIVSTLLATTIFGRSIQNLWLDIWAQVVGKFSANNGDDPTSIIYKAPDNTTTQLTHTLTDTTRDRS